MIERAAHTFLRTASRSTTIRVTPVIISRVLGFQSLFIMDPHSSFIYIAV